MPYACPSRLPSRRAHSRAEHDQGKPTAAASPARERVIRRTVRIKQVGKARAKGRRVANNPARRQAIRPPAPDSHPHKEKRVEARIIPTGMQTAAMQRPIYRLARITRLGKTIPAIRQGRMGVKGSLAVDHPARARAEGEMFPLLHLTRVAV